ncbi:MAG: M28 family peptidase [Acidobacteriaceae bacterium]|nr:M28 family peptidase [Acidobacteriaceae bacterium]
MAGVGASPSELQTAIDRDLKPQSRPLPDAVVTLHSQNTSETTGTTYNLAGLLEGFDPQLKAETILISGHHDHDGMSGNEIWHGADDNGSGTVGVVAVAPPASKATASSLGGAHDPLSSSSEIPMRLRRCVHYAPAVVVIARARASARSRQ